MKEDNFFTKDVTLTLTSSGSVSLCIPKACVLYLAKANGMDLKQFTRGFEGSWQYSTSNKLTLTLNKMEVK